MTDSRSAAESGDSDVPTVKDPDAYVNTRRLEDIFDARRDLRYQRLEVKKAAPADRFSAVSAYRAAVSSYLLEVEPLLLKYEPGPAYLHEMRFGTVVLVPDVWEAEYPQGRDTYKMNAEIGGSEKEIEIYEPPEPKEIPLEGLSCLFELDDPITETFEVERRGQGGRTTTVEREVTGQLTFNQVDDMARAINQFLAQIGFEIDREEGDDVAEIEYSDLL